MWWNVCCISVKAWQSWWEDAASHLGPKPTRQRVLLQVPREHLHYETWTKHTWIRKSLWDRDNIINLFACVCLETIIFITIITIIIGYYHNYWYHLQLFSLLNTNPYHWNIDNIYVSVNPSGSHNPWVAPRCKTRTEPRGLQRFATGAGAFQAPETGAKSNTKQMRYNCCFFVVLEDFFTY